MPIYITDEELTTIDTRRGVSRQPRPRREPRQPATPSEPCGAWADGTEDMLYYDGLHEMAYGAMKRDGTRKKGHPEHAEQIAGERWFCETYPQYALLFHASAGGMWTSDSQAKNMQRMGYKPGTPDRFLAIARQGYHGLFLEMKRAKGGRPSPEQRLMAAALREQGYKVEFVKGFREMKEIISEYLGEKTPCNSVNHPLLLTMAESLREQGFHVEISDGFNLNDLREKKP